MSDQREERDLEARVRELETTVDFLTSELVDAMERMSELEAELAEDRTTDEETAAADDEFVPATSDLLTGSATETDGGEEPETLSESDDIIVA